MKSCYVFILRMILLRFKHMRNLLVVTFILLLFGPQAKATHVMGGDLTWTCQGGSYVFQLVFYRDCNGADVNPVSENIEVWNHASINQISLLFVSREDVSPICTVVGGGPQALERTTAGCAGDLARNDKKP